MVALSANGFTLPVAAASYKDGALEIAERGRSLAGTTLGTRRARKWTASGTMVTTDPLEAYALRGMLSGDGYGFSFATDLRDDWKGNQGWSVTHAAREAGGKYSAGQMTVDSGYTTTFTFPTWWPGTTWAAAFWRKETSATEWEHWVKVYGTTTVWKDGAAGTALPAWLTFNTTTLTLAGAAGGNSKYSEMVIYPFFIPTTWPAVLAARTAAILKPPFLYMQGTLVTATGPTSYTCRGEARAASHQNRGALDTAQRIDFTVEEH